MILENFIRLNGFGFLPFRQGKMSGQRSGNSGKRNAAKEPAQAELRPPIPPLYPAMGDGSFAAMDDGSFAAMDDG